MSWGVGVGVGKFCQISLYKRLLHIYLFNIMNDEGFFFLKKTPQSKVLINPSANLL